MSSWLILFFSLSSFASDDGRFLEAMIRSENAKVSQKMFQDNLQNISAEEIYHKTQSVLRIYQVPEEKNYQSELDTINYSTDSADFDQHLKNLDPRAQFSRFYIHSPDRISSYRDRDSKKLSEYVILKSRHKRPESKSNSLQGVRIALDPGHMGGNIWDERTGKYVQKGKVRVSEGTIALQTALLIEKRLKQLGAEVLITHRDQGPASSVTYEKMDLLSYARQELRYQSLQDWFLALIASTPDQSLQTAFDNSAARKKLFSEIMRSDYYATREDLFFRNDLIRSFKPDLTVVIHFDAATREPQANVSNQSFAYVVGNFPSTDFATSEIRERILAHLSQQKMWQQSVSLSQLILKEVSKDLNVPLAQEAPWGLPVAPGVFTRNLVLSRQNTYSPMTYLECLYYANQAEFDRLSRLDGGTIEIGGKSLPYPDRLNVLASAITQGIVNFIHIPDDSASL